MLLLLNSFEKRYVLQAPVDWELQQPVISATGATDGGAGILETRPWLHIEPTSGHLHTGGETSITIKMGVSSASGFGLADPSTAEVLATSPAARAAAAAGKRTCPMSCTFVLHVVGGGDHFLVVDGEYEPSFFGLEVGTLAERGAQGLGPPEREMAWKVPEHSVIAAAPFAESQWEAVPLQLRALLHFLSRCASQ